MDIFEAKRILRENHYILEGNAHLSRAKSNKDDEFYTYEKDVAKEMQNYDFSGKTVYCMCDDPTWSNVYKYFEKNFDSLGLAGLISSHYVNGGESYYTRFENGERKEYPLKGNGDCLSPECRKLADEADIIVTNPPFSLFLDIVKAYKNKPFIMLCIELQMASKTCLELFKQGKLHYGYTRIGKFYRPNGEDDKKVNTIWYTNLDVPVRANNLKYVDYEEDNEQFSSYDNFDAVNCDSIHAIPQAKGLTVGIPITALHNIDVNNCPFEILGVRTDLKINDKKIFRRLIIRF